MHDCRKKPFTIDLVQVNRASEGAMSGTIFPLGEFNLSIHLRQLGARMESTFGNGTPSRYLDESYKVVRVTEIDGVMYVVPVSHHSGPPSITIKWDAKFYCPGCGKAIANDGDVEREDSDWECICSSQADGHEDDCPVRTGRPR